MKKPTTHEIRQKRIESGLTQEKAASLVNVSIRNWQQWEYGERTINMAAWELFTIKVDTK